MVTRKIMNNSSVTRKINQKGKGIRKTIKKLSNKYKKYKHSRNSKKLLKDRQKLLDEAHISYVFYTLISENDFNFFSKNKYAKSTLKINNFFRCSTEIDNDSLININIGIYLDVRAGFGIYAIKITSKNPNKPSIFRKEIFKLNKSIMNSTGTNNELCCTTLDEIEKHLNNEPLVSEDKNVKYLFKKFINIFDVKELSYNKNNVISNKLKANANKNENNEEKKIAVKKISKQVKKTKKKLAKYTVGNKYKRTPMEKFRNNVKRYMLRKYKQYNGHSSIETESNIFKDKVNIFIDYTSLMDMDYITGKNISNDIQDLVDSFTDEYTKFLSVSDNTKKYYRDIDFTNIKLSTKNRTKKFNTDKVLIITTIQNMKNGNNSFINKLKEKGVYNDNNANIILIDNEDPLSIKLLVQMLKENSKQNYEYKVLSNNSITNNNKKIIYSGDGSKKKHSPYQINNIQTTVFGGIPSKEYNIKLPTVFLGPIFSESNNKEFVERHLANPNRSKVYFKLSDDMYKRLFKQKGYKDQYKTINLMHPRRDLFLTINHNNNISKTKIDNPNIKLIIFSDKIENIGEDAFNGKESLKFDFSEAVNLTTINKNAFKGCKNIIGELKLPEKINEIGKSAFEGCTGITELDLSNTKLVKIDENTFKDCSNIKTIILPDTLEYIDNKAFEGCTNINTVIPTGHNILYKDIYNAITPYLKNQNNFKIKWKIINNYLI